MNISFSKLPNSQNLFLDYLYQFENVKSFYHYNFRIEDEYPAIFKQIYSREIGHLHSIKEIIKNQYSLFEDISLKTKKNIELLGDKKSLFIITGQQLGILGGPLYTFYKIFTAIKLSEHLNQKYDDYYFIPLFWMESDDHDFQEVNSINVLNNENNLISLSYKEIIEEEFKESIGSIIIDNSIDNFFKKIEKELRNTEFKINLLSKLQQFYKTGKTFKQAFRELLFSVFDKYGLIIFDPQDVEVKKLLKPILITEIKNYRIHSQRLVSISAFLEENYHTQVKIRPVNLFYTLDNGRYAIEPDENIFKLRRKRKQFTFEELLFEAENFPEKFSTNVILRPIAQDYLFKTAFYVAGPTEICYFAQINPLYELFHIVPPIIFPRASATLLEKHILNFIEKYGIEIQEIFSEKEIIKEKIFNKISEINLNNIFDDTNNKINLLYDQLKQDLFRIDKTLADSVDRFKERTLQILSELKNKSKKHQEVRYDTILRQFNKLNNLLYPHLNFQERELSHIYFVNKFGEDLLDKIYAELLIFNFEHQIIII